MRSARAYHACVVVKSFKTDDGSREEAIVCAGGVDVGGGSGQEVLDTIEVWFFGKFIQDAEHNKWEQLQAKLKK
jgi:hypothetical protein